VLLLAWVDPLRRVAQLGTAPGPGTAETRGDRLKSSPKILSVFFTQGCGDAEAIDARPSMSGMRENQPDNEVG